jgi:hypothetical protein
MFRWTGRLRDVLEKRRDGSNRVSGRVLEAEFTCHDGTFPDPLRWECFVNNYWGGKLDDCNLGNGRDYLLLGSTCATLQLLCAGPVDSDPSHFQFDVLWLSPVVFISHYRFCISNVCPFDYAVAFTRRGGSCARFFIYRMSSFNSQIKADSPSLLLPIDFFRHLIAFLPGDFFSEIALIGRWPPIPVTVHLQLLAIIPRDAPMPTQTQNHSVTFRLGNVATGNDIRQILAHPFHPSVRLEFDDRCSFLGLISLDKFNHLLLESQYLRAIKIPSPLVKAHAATPGGAFVFEQALFTSSRLSIGLEGRVSFSVLHSLAKFHRIIDIKMATSFGGLHDLQGRKKAVSSYFDPHLHEDSPLERLEVWFGDINCWDRPPIEFSPCFSRKLRFVSISFPGYCEPGWISFYGVPAVPARGVVDEVEQWDVALFPSVVLNCYRNHLYKRQDGGTLALAIKAVNEGQVYRRATDHTPFNMSISNAGLIFYVIRMQARGQAGYGGSTFEGLPPAKKT